MSSNTGANIDVSDDVKVQEDNINFFYDLMSAPCFRQSALYGIGGGAVIGSLNFTANRDALRSAETMVKTGCAISLATWVLCRRQFYTEREMTYESMEKYRRNAALRAAARAKTMRENPNSNKNGNIEGEGHSSTQ